ncbi:hypothetical protein ACI2J5_25955, partial [Agrobacterium pusense]|uniref:hypothetical protein n=1 Tax=Agrobacterium pusense TaxID=648995 RepID=UPI00384E4A3B
PHHTPPLPPRIQQPKTAGANSKLDKTWGQGHQNTLDRLVELVNNATSEEAIVVGEWPST